MNDLKMFQEIELQSIPLQMANAIRQKIYDGKLKPGEKIPKQEALADLFGVSRPSIREALNLLVEEQLIMQASGREGGYVVSEFHPEKVFKNVHDIIVLSLTFQTLTEWHLFEVRKMIEIPCAALAAERRTEEDLKELEECLPQPHILSKPVKEIVDADIQFHIKLAECTHNPLAKTLLSAVISSYHQIPIEYAKNEKQYIIAELPNLFNAIKQRDPEKAKQYLERHMQYFIEYHRP